MRKEVRDYELTRNAREWYPIRMANDPQTRREIQSFFYQANIDTRRLNVRVRSGICNISGGCFRIGSDAPDSVPLHTMELIDRYIRRIKGIRTVRYDIANMSNAGGSWKYIGKTAGTGTAGKPADTSQSDRIKTIKPGDDED